MKTTRTTLLDQALREIQAPVQVHAVTTVEALLEFLRRELDSSFGVHPALILVDLNLPAVNGVVGLDVIKLTEAWCEIPIFILSSSGRSADRVDARNRGASDYWVKPSVYDGFLECAERIRDRLPAPRTGGASPWSL